MKAWRPANRICCCPACCLQARANEAAAQLEEAHARLAALKQAEALRSNVGASGSAPGATAGQREGEQEAPEAAAAVTPEQEEAAAAADKLRAREQEQEAAAAAAMAEAANAMLQAALEQLEAERARSASLEVRAGQTPAAAGALCVPAAAQPSGGASLPGARPFRHLGGSAVRARWRPLGFQWQFPWHDSSARLVVPARLHVGKHRAGAWHPYGRPEQCPAALACRPSISWPLIRHLPACPPAPACLQAQAAEAAAQLEGLSARFREATQSLQEERKRIADLQVRHRAPALCVLYTHVHTQYIQCIQSPCMAGPGGPGAGQLGMPGHLAQPTVATWSVRRRRPPPRPLP